MSKQLGWIFLVSGLKSQPVHAVRAAAKKSGIPEEYCRDIRDFCAAKRAIRQLVERGIAENYVESGDAGILRDKISEDSEWFSFQLSARWLNTRKDGVHYEKVSVITFHKESGEITCDDKKMAELLQKLIEECKLTATTTDIHRVVYQLCDANFKRLLLKDGVYFCGVQHREILEKVRNFYRRLGARFWQQPVGHGVDDDKQLAAEVIEDMKQHVTELKKKMDDLKENKSRKGVTQKIAVNMIEELRDAVEKYRDLAESIQADATKLFKAAGDAGDVLALSENEPHALVMMAKQGREISPIIHELARAADGEPAIQVEILPQRAISVISNVSRGKGRKRAGSRFIPVVGRSREAV